MSNWNSLIIIIIITSYPWPHLLGAPVFLLPLCTWLFSILDISSDSDHVWVVISCVVHSITMMSLRFTMNRASELHFLFQAEENSTCDYLLFTGIVLLHKWIFTLLLPLSYIIISRFHIKRNSNPRKQLSLTLTGKMNPFTRRTQAVGCLSWHCP